MTALSKLTRAERLQLLKFVCAAAWADLEVSPTERTYIQSLTLRLGLSKDEVEQVEGWLETPPSADEMDPNKIPPEHRRLILDAVEHTMTSDRVVDGPELDMVRLLRDLLG